MKTEARKEKPFMLSGMDAKCSLDAARTIARFKELERQGVVRVRAEPEQESYFDVFGTPEGYERNGHPVSEKEATKEMEETLERDGCWWTCSEWRADDESEWEEAGSCGMHAGYKNPLSPWENCYIVGEMRAAVDAYEAHMDEQESEESETQDAACRDIVTV